MAVLGPLASAMISVPPYLGVPALLVVDVVEEEVQPEINRATINKIDRKRNAFFINRLLT
jgi:hypothetical protein